MSDFYNDEQEDYLEDLVEVPDDESLGIDMDTDENEDENMSLTERNEIDIEESNHVNQEVHDNSHSFFAGHTDSVYCAAIHPKYSPRIILTGGGDDRAFIWQVENGQVSSAVELTGHKDTVTKVGFNFDGSLAFTGSYDGSIRIWRVPNSIPRGTTVLQPACVLDGGPEDIEWASWHSKGNAIVAGSRDGTVWMWLIQDNSSSGVVTGQCSQVFAGHDGPVSCGGFTLDGKFVFTGGEDGTVRVWLPKSGACKHVFEVHEAMITCCEGSQDGDLIISGSADGTVSLLQISKKRVLLKLVHSSSSPVANSANLNAIEEENEDDGEEDDAEEVMAVETVGFDCAGMKWAASGGMDKTLKIWDLTSGSCRCTCLHEGSVVSLKWHTSLPMVCTAALDNIVRLWDARSGTVLTTFTGHTDLVTDIIFSPAIVGSSASGEQPISAETVLDCVVSVSDDRTSRVFMIDSVLLFNR